MPRLNLVQVMAARAGAEQTAGRSAEALDLRRRAVALARSEAERAVEMGRRGVEAMFLLEAGTYDLRITVHLEDGRQSVSIIPDLRVRNYTPIETNTPTLTSTPLPGDTPDPTSTKTPPNTQVPLTNTPFPVNPAQLSNSDLTHSLVIGALITFAGFLLIGFYVILKRYVA